MTQEEILESNKIIAEFLGYSEGYPHKIDQYGYEQTVEGYKINGVDIATDDLKYHYSWDWLMPVAEKISKLGEVYYFSILPNASTDIMLKTITIDDAFIFNFHVEESQSTLDCVYKTVVSFIKWYNQNEKTEN